MITNSFRSAGSTVTVSEIGTLLSSNPVRRISNHRYTSAAWQVEKHRLVLIWRTDRDVITIASMPEPEIISQIFYCAFVDILILYKPVTAVCDQVHRVKNRLQ